MHGVLTTILLVCCEKTNSCGENKLQRCSKFEVLNVCKGVGMY